jgi:HEAT repeat protein
MRSLIFAVFAAGSAVAGHTVAPAVGHAGARAAHAAALDVAALRRALLAPDADARRLAGLRVAAPPAAWAPADSADSLYRAARAAMSDGDFDRAAALFGEIPARYPASSYAADALYYRAFALYRVGGTGNLRAALAALDTQRTKYGRAGTRGDAAALATRIRGELAQGGDANEAERVAAGARAAAGASCPTDDDDDDRAAALNALLQMDTEQAVPILNRVLARRDACSAPLRRKAVFLLSQKETPETADALLRVAETDPDREVREQAVFALSQVESARATDVLIGIVNNGRDEGLQEKALFALSQQGGERGAQALRDVAGREGASEELREKAIFWLGQGRPGESAAFLKSLYGRLRSENLKEKVLFSLSQGRAADPWLLDVALNASESTELRKKALFYAGQNEQGVPVARLAALYDRLSDRELREQIIFVYSQRRERAAVDRLMQIARSERDAELRKKAIFWLGQSRDPRAAEFLLGLIER